jgi:transcriptional regulator with XRE-family HTH domain
MGKALTAEAAAEIRALYGGDARMHETDGRFGSSGRLTQGELGQRFGVSQTTVSAIIRGQVHAEPRVYKRRGLRARFDEKVRPDPRSGCWLWGGATRVDGRGIIRGEASEMVLAYRVAFELYVGPIGAGLFVCHHCDNPSCVNPAHLFAGTAGDNHRDMMRKGRGSPPPASVGSAASWSKLTEEIVRECRARYADGESQSVLAREFGVSKPTMQHAIAGLTWRHVRL